MLKVDDVIPDHFVRGDDDVILMKSWDKLRAFTRIASIQNGSQVIRILQDLIVPVTSKRGRTDDERGKVDGIWELSHIISLFALVMLAS